MTTGFYATAARYLIDMFCLGSTYNINNKKIIIQYDTNNFFLDKYFFQFRVIGVNW